VQENISGRPDEFKYDNVFFHPDDERYKDYVPKSLFKDAFVEDIR
jgi:hypothetical protein